MLLYITYKQISTKCIKCTCLYGLDESFINLLFEQPISENLHILSNFVENALNIQYVL